MSHINIPIFIPHLGCPNQCIFCNQRYISGKECFDKSKVENIINDVLSTTNSSDICEIAFFGGSFTGIDKTLMIELLDLAQKYVDAGKVHGIRMSTRPDYISSEIINILKKYTISVVELGIQSMNDNILRYLKRGHSANDTKKAAELLNKANIPFIGQMMIGLPKASELDELNCAKLICDLGAAGARIYPTLVFKMTELEELTLKNEYTPLSAEEAIERCVRVLKVFQKHNVPCIRIGLCDSENLHSEDTFVAGPNTPPMGEMVKSRLYYDLICERYEQNRFDNIIIECAKGKTSQVIGHKKENLQKISKKYKINSIKVIENINLSNFEINIKNKEEIKCV